VYAFEEHMTFYTDGRDFDDDGAWPDEEDVGGAAAPRLTLPPRISRAQMDAEPLEFLAPEARGFPRGITTLLTGLGGTFKTRTVLEYLFAVSQGEAPFGCALLAPPEPLICLYIGAEDGRRFFHYLARPLLRNADDTATLPFDVVLLPDLAPGFTLTKTTARELADFLARVRGTRGRLDCVVLDPMLALIGREYADMMKNPVVARAFYVDCLQPLFAVGDFALITNNHDSKAGAAVTGSADQQNAGRLVLQFHRGDAIARSLKSVIIEQVKDNVGFRFQQVVLDPDPESLRLVWNEHESVYAYGAPPGASARSSKPSNDPASIMRYLCRQAVRLLSPKEAPPEQRSKRSVESRLTQQAAREGYPKARDHVRRCLNGFCAFEPDRTLKKGQRLILVGVRNPDAAMDDHDDYLAGRAPAEPPPNPGDAFKGAS
jgi:hypothetical protein